MIGLMPAWDQSCWFESAEPTVNCGCAPECRHSLSGFKFKTSDRPILAGFTRRARREVTEDGARFFSEIGPGRGRGPLLDDGARR